MARQFDTSFIPKGPTADGGSGGGGGFNLRSVFLVIALIVFLGTVAAGVGVFLYQEYLDRTISSKEQSLERSQEAFDPNLIEELDRLDVRINTAEQILNQHVSFSAFFRELEQLTLQSVRFDSFDYSVENESAALEMTGEAETFADVALQSQRFGEGDIIQEPIFSDLNVTDTGRVSFSVTAQINLNELRYVDNLSLYQQQAPDSEEGGNGTSTPSESE